MKKVISLLAAAGLTVTMLATGVSAEPTCMEVPVLKFTAEPTFDGVISEDEWGAPTLRVVTEGAATIDDDSLGRNDELGLFNTFYWFDVEEMYDSLAYDMWLRWDTDNLYIAVRVEDPDPFSQPNSGASAWQGDSIQFAIDPKGPCAKMKSNKPEWDYKTDAYDGKHVKNPWSGSEYFVISALQYGTTPTFWGYVKYDNGEGGHEITKEGGKVGIEVETHPAKTAEDLETNTISYEMAIPWTEISETASPAAGVAYGMSFVASSSDGNEPAAWLQWGNGVKDAYDVKTNKTTMLSGAKGGSNAILLSDESVTPAETYPVATEAPETTEGEGENTPPAVESGSAAGTGTSGETALPGGTNGTAEAPAETNGGGDSGDSEGLPKGAIVGIAAVVIVAAAAVIIGVVAAGKKKKK